MQFIKSTVPERIEILANDHYVGIPVKVALTPGQVRKAGTPLTRNGALATGADAEGILLYGVSERNPNGTLVIHGFIETERAYDLSGITITQSMKDALPMVWFN